VTFFATLNTNSDEDRLIDAMLTVLRGLWTHRILGTPIQSLIILHVIIGPWPRVPNVTLSVCALVRANKSPRQIVSYGNFEGSCDPLIRISHA
jgi:hypothetical protein